MSGGEGDAKGAAEKPSSAVFETPPNRVAEKVSKGGPDAVTVDRLEALEEDIVARFSAQYLEWVENDLDRSLDALEGIEAGDHVDAPSVQAFRAIIHDMRGMGGTFDYDLVTTIANQVHRLVHAVGTLGADHLMALRVHVDAIKVVVAERLTGDGGERGREVLDGLQKVYRKYV